ncbi:MAG: tetratricopeptide repeat protein [Anaerolineae bacterium]|nr:tetratricopeptide repeat protein [Anaerolineae bacterium]
MTSVQQAGQSSKTPHNLPGQLTPFVGRADELAKITQRLANPACRLLTLVGPGGIGKTRLAIQAAGELLPNFADGVYFVSLQPVETPDYIIAAMADTLNFSLSGQQEPQTQLANYLSHKQLLLIPDNFEHLLAGVAMLTDLLHATTGLKLLVTSREALNLQEEWLYQVDGLPYPADNRAEALETYGAVQLFMSCARRVRPGLSLEDERDGVAQICRLVEGTPLAIELATSWAKSLTCAEIAAEIQQNLDFLATRWRDIPSRHRSIQAVFNHSWQLLNPQEQSVYKRLAVFRGAFRRQAAEQVAEASLMTLTALVDKSLLRWTPEGHYQIHELLRQYAAEHLARSPEDVAQVYDLHCAYYADFLHQRLDDIRGRRQQAATVEIEQELENIRAAWQWAIELNKVAEIQKSDETLDLFFQYRGRYLEGVIAFEKAIHNLDKQAPTVEIRQTLVGLLTILAWYYIRLGRLTEAEAMATRCQKLYQQLDIPPLPKYTSDPRLLSGMVALIRGEYDSAAAIAEEVRHSCEAHPNAGNDQTACYLLARAALLRGDYESAQTYIQQAYATVQATGDRWFRAYCRIEMGNIAAALQKYATAKAHYQAAYVLRQKFNDPEGMAVALNHLGEVALQQKDFAGAGQLFEQSHTIYRQIGDRGGLAAALNGLGRSAVAGGDGHSARRYFQQALEIAAEMQFMPLLLSILAAIADLLHQTGSAELRLDLLSLIAHHPASTPEIRAQARRSLPTDVSPPADDLSPLLIRVQSLLSAPATAAEPGASEPIAAAAAPAQNSSLVEPLTGREIEVLHLMAEGLTNPEIAGRLIIATGTVKYYTGQIYGKLGVRNRVEAVARGRELQLL